MMRGDEMTRSRKNIFGCCWRWYWVFFALPFGSSEAHEADGNLTASECERLGSLSLDQMDGRLRLLPKNAIWWRLPTIGSNSMAT